MSAASNPTSRITDQRLSLVSLHASEDYDLFDEYKRHLTPLRSRVHHWHRDSLAGQSTEEFRERAMQADLLVVLLSASFFNDPMCEHITAEARMRGVPVVPVLLKAVDLHATAFAAQQPLPSDGPVQRATDAAQQQSLATVIASLRKLLEYLGARDSAAESCPFPGLESFDEPMARYFFGREEELREVLSLLGRGASSHRRWLQIEGGSGTGKSSFARAAIVPAIRRGMLKGAPSTWRVAVLRPGRSPLLSLSQALLFSLGLKERHITLEAVEGRLRQSHEGLRNLILESLVEQEGLLLVLDQLEEAFTLASAASDLPQLDVLLDTTLSSDAPFYLLTTVRSDFLGKFGMLPRLEGGLNLLVHRYHLKPMGPEALYKAILGPAALAGLQMERGLEESIVRDAQAARGALPLVGHVLRALWEACCGDTLTLGAYNTLGGVSGALTRNADELLASMTADQQVQAKRLLVSLVKTGRGSEDTRRVISRNEALDFAGGGEAAEQVLLRLSGGRDPQASGRTAAPPRLISVSEDRVDVIHEQLIHLWKTLREQVEEDRKELERRDDLEAAVQSWEAAGQPEGGLPQGEQLAYFHLVRYDLTSRRAQDFLDRADRLAGWRRRELQMLPRAMLGYMGMFAAVIAFLSAGVLYGQQFGSIERDRTQRAHLLLGYLAAQSQLGAYAGDRTLLSLPVSRMADQEDVVFVAIYDAKGRELLRTLARYSGRPPPEPPSGLLATVLNDAARETESAQDPTRDLFDQGVSRRVWPIQNEPLNCTDLYAAIVISERGEPGVAAYVHPSDRLARSRVVGVVRVGLLMKSGLERLQEVLRWGTALGVCILISGILMLIRINRRLASPIAAFKGL